MLVLTRRSGQRIVLGDNIILTVVSISGRRVQLGIEAPPEINIVREELKPRPAVRRAKSQALVHDPAHPSFPFAVKDADHVEE
jgi:carbon storage regulator